MKQLLLDLNAHRQPSLSTFVVGRNSELVSLLSRIEQHSVSDLNERFVYLWGEAGAGKTHLLQALAAQAKSHYIHGEAKKEAFSYQPDISLYLIDDCHRMSIHAQVGAFTLFNQVRDGGGVLVVAGNLAPAALTIREDLRTRLGWGLIYQVHGLTDDEKIAALQHAADARGLVLSTGVLPYLLTHFRRDMTSLSAMLDALDKYSLETQRPITLPLLKSLLQQEGDASTGSTA